MKASICKYLDSKLTSLLPSQTLVLVSHPPTDFPMLQICRNKMQIRCTFITWTVKLENYSLMGKPTNKQGSGRIRIVNREGEKIDKDGQ